MNPNLENTWYNVHDENKIITPGLLISPEKIKDNIEAMIQISGTANRLWPHIKTYKMKPVIELQKDYGINRFKCATLSEVELLCKAEVGHILLAIQPTEKKLDAFLNLQKKYPKIQFSTLLDNNKSLSLFDRIASQKKQTLGVWIDLNIGMNRTGIIPNKNGFKLYRNIKESQLIRFMGLHAYDGHIRSESEIKRKADSDNAFLSVLYLKEKMYF